MLKRIARLFKRKTSKSILDNLKLGGADIGIGCQIYDCEKVCIDSTRPWLLKIGNYVRITRGCVILTHDYSLSVIRRTYGEWIGEGGQTIIGDNVFLGMNSIVLMGAKIGNNVVVGAGSVVKGVIPDNCVIAGNPARVICTLDDYYKSRSEKSIKEAKECIRVYYDRFGKTPRPSDLAGFKFLFAERSWDYLKENGLSFSCTGDEPKEVEEMFFKTKPICSFEDLVKSALEE